MQKDKAFRVGAIMEHATNRLLPHVPGEELQPARLLLVVGIVASGVAALLLAMHLTSFAYPLFPPARWTDIPLDVITLLAGLLILWLTRSERIRLAACVVLDFVLALAAITLYLEGHPPSDMVGVLVLLVAVVLSMVLLGRRGAWLTFAIASVAYRGMIFLYSVISTVE
jgi:hypothetical protein